MKPQPRHQDYNELEQPEGYEEQEEANDTAVWMQLQEPAQAQRDYAPLIVTLILFAISLTLILTSPEIVG
jgi:hypothetical protein